MNYASRKFKLIVILLLFSFQLIPVSPVSFGNKVTLKTNDIYGKTVHLSKKGITLLLFFNPSSTSNKITLFYSQALYNKFKSDGFQIVGIAKGEKSVLMEFSQKSGIQFPLVLDTNLKIHQQLGVVDCCGATILVDKTGKRKFFLPRLMDSGSLRQLVEKEITGKIEYDQKRIKQNVFHINKKAPDILLFDTDTGKELSFDSMNKNPTVVTFFSTFCGMCKTGKRIRSLIGIEETLGSSGKDKGFNFVLVFMGPFVVKDIVEWEKQIPMPFEKYLTGYLFSEEEKYITTPSKRNDPFTIILNNEKKVIFIQEEGIGEKSLSEAIIRFILRRNGEK